MNKLLFILLFILIGSQNLFAVIAYPYPVEYQQPDGRTITVILRGDESLHWYETVDGYTLLKNRDGIFEYVTQNTNNDLVPSGIAVKNVAERTSSEKAFLAATPTNLT
jgi:hypothetical protein